LLQWRGEREACGLEGLAPHDEGDEEASTSRCKWGRRGLY
jgi:hypothetical protein